MAMFTVQVSAEVEADSEEEAASRVVGAIQDVRPAMDCIVDSVVNEDEAADQLEDEEEDVTDGGWPRDSPPVAETAPFPTLAQKTDQW
jgi:hypothetical protein